ncbi:hypothetical protein, partial [Nostoc sp. WHI]|uniref:hypothetical protein n=1 Tax=Nostoc sp. WHI TaxID=2650611 RepID=UPI0018C82E4D
EWGVGFFFPYSLFPIPYSLILGGIFLWHYPHDRSHWTLSSKFGLSGVRTFLKPVTMTDLQLPAPTLSLDPV